MSSSPPKREAREELTYQNLCSDNTLAQRFEQDENKS
jgi:hypothetical protein